MKESAFVFRQGKKARGNTSIRKATQKRGLGHPLSHQTLTSEVFCPHPLHNNQLITRSSFVCIATPSDSE